MNHWLCRILFGAVLLTMLASPLRAEVRPNIIFIMADDMGREWVSCYGAAHRTPHIDRLAEQGVRFLNAWSSPICTPTRCQLLTGRYPFRTGWTDHHDVPRWGGKGLDPDREVTFARLLKQAGYATVIGGKWQINDLRKDPAILKKHGFDEHCVWVGYEAGNRPSGQRYWDPFLQTNGDRKTHESKFGPDLVNDFLIDFIKRHRKERFLAYYPMTLPHPPNVATPLNKNDPPPKGQQMYAGMVTYVDHLVGRIVKTVDDLGLADRTVIIFTTDNGSPVGGGQIDGQAYPAGKGKIADCGMHAPFVVRAPVLTKGGRVTDDLVDFSDILPTLAELAGAPLPAGVNLDGRSFVPTIRGTAGAKREWIYAQRGPARAVRDRRYKLDFTGSLWDLTRDPLEKNDLRNSDDKDVQAARERLKKVLAGFPPNGPAPFEGFRPAEEAEAKKKPAGSNP